MLISSSWKENFDSAVFILNVLTKSKNILTEQIIVFVSYVGRFGYLDEWY